MGNKVLKPFDIVSSPYVSLDGNIKVNKDGTVQKALFMVLSLDYDNILCAKITSQCNPIFLSHSVMLSKAANSFLRTDSYVQLDKLHTLSVESCSFIGFVDKPSRYSIYRILDGFFTSIAENVKRFCTITNDEYISPNRR